MLHTLFLIFVTQKLNDTVRLLHPFTCFSCVLSMVYFPKIMNLVVFP